MTVTETCWFWSSKSYGKFRINGRIVSAHRFVYELMHGPIPAGAIIRHSCDVRECVNPNHLLLGTHALNANDRKVRGRNNTAHGERAGQARLTEQQVLDIRRRYAAGNVYQYDLAREYGVSQPNIQAIVTGRSWAHLPIHA
jgi:hypothetical protein